MSTAGPGGAQFPQISVDHELCSGTGHCREVAPKLFTLRDRRAWLVEGASPADFGDGLLRQAEEACPWFAITYTPKGDLCGKIS
ncbi:ferredoxin [Streptomyces mirabilis]|uniref:ferredoxin n=1 Tax=Streptomyces mirabilis TaxID=68239 RepID=UPI00367A91EB